MRLETWGRPTRVRMSVKHLSEASVVPKAAVVGMFQPVGADWRVEAATTAVTGPPSNNYDLKAAQAKPASVSHRQRPVASHRAS